MPFYIVKPLTERFWEKVDKSLIHNGCWIWTAHLVRNGYGHFRIGSRTDGSHTMVYSHRFSYEERRGPVPDGLQLDHLCRNRACVNPDHLEAVTAAENVRRGIRPEKTHCPSGHSYDATNTGVNRKGVKVCRMCRRLDSQRRRAATYLEGGKIHGTKVS